MQLVSETNFEEAIAEGTVVVDFYADWCGPCKSLASYLQTAESKFPIKFIKINTDESEDLAAEYNIRSLPTLVVFKNGKESDRLVGFSPMATENLLKKVSE